MQTLPDDSPKEVHGDALVIVLLDKLEQVVPKYFHHHADVRAVRSVVLKIV